MCFTILSGPREIQHHSASFWGGGGGVVQHGFFVVQLGFLLFSLVFSLFSLVFCCSASPGGARIILGGGEAGFPGRPHHSDLECSTHNREREPSKNAIYDAVTGPGSYGSW